MHEFSTVDGFVEISECMAEMIKYVANEPSVGLFFIQHHAQNAVPNVIKVKENLVEKFHETTLHREDLEDSITMVQTMKECGFPIADEMIREIKKSLVTMTTKQPKRGLIRPSASSSQTQRTSFWGNTSFYAQQGDEKRSSYFSNVLTSAKQKVNSLKWQQPDGRGSIDSKGEKPEMYPDLPLSVTSASITSSLQDTETDELPISSQVEDESQQEQTDVSDISIKLLSVSERYDDFKANKEAKLEEWLEGSSNFDDNIGKGDEKRY
ncbi:BLOC-1-related complex subunit 8 [Sesbania bispinosa]|nr:BLOC-1-related complex subunit 8 [Sesbania bispinosa]